MGKLERTRAEILDAAWDLVSGKGADVSVAEIAKAAGITRQSVYLHFGTRGGLLVALVRRADERFAIHDKLLAVLQIEDPGQRLDHAIKVWLAFLPGILPVARDLIRLRDTDRDAAGAWDDRMAALRDWLLQLTRSLKSDGALAPEWTPEDARDYLWARTSIQAWDLLVGECGWTQEKAESVLSGSLLAELLG
jgi:AcrR family transcriptional regulator